MNTAPLARRFDPATSHEAADMIVRHIPVQCAEVIRGLQASGPAGAEGIAYCCDLDAVQVRKRLPQLQRWGLAQPTGQRVTTSTGRSERVWELV